MLSFIRFIFAFSILATICEFRVFSESKQVPNPIVHHDHSEEYEIGVNRSTRHYSTHKYHSECGFRCSDGTCVKATNKCDGTVNCNDASDETGCECLDRIGSKKRCDGIEDCPYGEDELGCGLGCGDDEFSCATSRSVVSTLCIKNSQRCDGNVDCSPTHSDENDCFRLSALDSKVRGIINFGVLQKRIGNEWHTICKSSGRSESQLADKYAKKTCEILVGDVVGEDPTVTTVNVDDYEGVEMTFSKLQDKENKFSVTSTCSSGTAYYVQCPEPECGWPVKKYDKYFVHTVQHSKHNYETSGDHYLYKRSYNNVHGLTAKIVGGQDSEMGDWPFIVGIYRNGSFHCGGSLLSKEWLLTAAHCTHGFEKYAFEVQVGMTRRYSYSPKEQTRTVSEIHVHERYDSKIFMNDIALMKVEAPFHLSKYATTACLATDQSLDPNEGDECTVIGWGDLSEDGTGPDHLQQVKLPVLKKCLETFTKDDLQICAAVLEGGKDACQGDSGGPLICTNSQGRQIVNGLVSFGRGCARPDNAGVYTRVSAYTSWIENTMSGVSKLKKYPRTCDQKCPRGGGECLFPKLLCDGHVDCLNAEDEINCQLRSRSIAHDDADEEAYDDIKRIAHATEEHTHEYGTAKLCDASEYQCKTTLSCIPLELKCNGNFDCSDNTDEKNCECGDIIKNSHPELYCDGLQHCLDGTDEINCEKKICDGISGNVQCPLSGTCIEESKWCNGNVDCPFGEDEVDCIRIFKLKSSLPETHGFLEGKMSRGLQTGYVVIQNSGIKWQFACTEEFGKTMGETVCPYLGFLTPESVISRNARSIASPFSWRSKRSSSATDSPCHQIKLSCGGDTSCGLRKLYAMSKESPRADQPGAYPWLANLLVEGVEKCPATLVHKQWLVVASSCFDEHVRSTTTEYLSAITGFSKSSNIMTTVMEQTKRINSVVKLSDGLTLLRLESALTNDHFTTPICPAFSGLSLTSNTPTCVRVKIINGTVYDRKVNYDPSCESSGHHCLKYSPKKCKAATEYFVYCTQDNSSWFLLGYATAEAVSKCSPSGKLMLKNPFYGTEGTETKSLLNRPVSTLIKPPGCTGTRCTSGTCIGNKFVCDGVAHCEDGADERRCQRHYQRLLRSHDVEDEDEYEATRPYRNQSSYDSCPVGHFKCQMTGNCVPISAFCDGVYDCGYDDPSDEPEPEYCTCRYYLELAAPQSVCHPSGRSRCPDRSDQLNCPCGPDSFVCDQQARECVHKNLVCDSVKDCSNGLDEALCAAVSSTLANITMDRSERVLEGYVLVRIRGSWHPYCSNQWSVEMAQKICQFLGYKTLADLQVLNLEELNQNQESPNDPFTSTEDDNSRRLWIFGKSHNAAIDTGPVDDVVLEATSGEGIECNVAYIKCSKI